MSTEKRRICRTLEPLDVDNRRWRWTVWAERETRGAGGYWRIDYDGWRFEGTTRNRERALRRMNRAETRIREHLVLREVTAMNREAHTLRQTGTL